jgi:SAM-dependent methyltransferase
VKAKLGGKQEGQVTNEYGGTAGFPRRQSSEWFSERYYGAADQIIEFFGSEFHTLTGKSVADIGCGDGIVDLGLFHRASPALLVGFDKRPTDARVLARLAEDEGRPGELPEGLQFRTSPAEALDAESESFDLAFSWSAFHHLEDPVGAISEIRRVLRPGGVLMIQLYPFFNSPHGSLLEHWYPDGFAQFLHTDEQIASTVRSDPRPDPEWAEHLLEGYRRLNRLTLDELGVMLTQGGFRITRLQVIGEDARIPPELAGRPLSQLGVGGAKLLAVRL